MLWENKERSDYDETKKDNESRRRKSQEVTFKRVKELPSREKERGITLRGNNFSKMYVHRLSYYQKKSTFSFIDITKNTHFLWPLKMK